MKRAYNSKISEKANASLNRREAVVRSQKRIIAVVAIIIISLGILLGTGISALASSKPDAASYNKYYKSVRVEAGDTLWSIAEDYIKEVDINREEYIAEICELNNIYEDEIHSGDYIVVAYYSKEVK